MNRRLAATVRAPHDSFARNLTSAALSASRHLLSDAVERHLTIVAGVTARGPARDVMASHIRRSDDPVVWRLEETQT